MTFEQLTKHFAAYDRKLDATILLNKAVLKESRLTKARSTLWRQSAKTLAEVLINLVAVALLGSFIGDHFREPAFAAPAIWLDMVAIFLVATGGYQAVTMARMDLSRPIIESQKELQALRVQRTWITKWTLLIAPLLWTPLLIVGMRFLGIDAYKGLGATYLLANVAFGIAVIPVMLWISHRFAARWSHTPFVKELMDDVAGRSLTKAAADLNALAAFESEA